MYVMIDERYGRWTVVAAAFSDANNKKMFKCVCDCGAIAEVRGSELLNGLSASCGCYRRDLATSHGDAYSPEYSIWGLMRQRCENPNSPNYHNYGGRGIAVCPEWNRYERFLKDMGRRPSDQHSIERRDVNGNYEPTNCYWATMDVQANNKRTSHQYTMFGVDKTATQWARELDVPAYKLRHLLSQNKTMEDAVQILSGKSA